MKNINTIWKVAGFAMICLTFLSFNVQGQNALTNGDFESGIAPWAIGGPNSGAFSCEETWRFQADASDVCCCVSTLPSAFQGVTAAYSSFDGVGPINHYMAQDVAIPASLSQADLTWQQTASTDFFGLDRVLSIEVHTSGAGAGSTPLAVGYTEVFTGQEDYGWQARSANLLTALTPHAGTTVQIRVNLFVPENFTGPARIGIDDLDLQFSGSNNPIPTLSQWGLILLALVVVSFGVVMIWKRRFSQASA